MFQFGLYELDWLTFFAFVLRNVTRTNFTKSAKGCVQTFEIAWIHKFNAVLVVQRLNGNMILRAQLLLVQIDVIFVQAQNCLYYYKVAIDKALK